MNRIRVVPALGLLLLGLSVGTLGCSDGGGTGADAAPEITGVGAPSSAQNQEEYMKEQMERQKSAYGGTKKK